MTNRILEISETGAYIHYANSLLVIKFKEREQVTVPVEEIGVVLLANPALSISQQALEAVCEAGGMTVICGKKHTPCGMFLPVSMHTQSARNLETQAEATLPLKKRVWQSIVKAKIRFQGRLLKHLYRQDFGLLGMAELVKSGDQGNLEAQAAQKYWRKIFADEKFRRNREAADQNRFLNYGYTILRACTARAVCAAGLHPSLGIHHHNQYNSFRLADDLMEPFRPLVDKKVVEILKEQAPATPFTKELRQKLLEITIDSILLEGEQVSIFQALTRSAVSLLQVFEKKINRIVIPESLLASAEQG